MVEGTAASGGRTLSTCTVDHEPCRTNQEIVSRVRREEQAKATAESNKETHAHVAVAAVAAFLLSQALANAL